MSRERRQYPRANVNIALRTDGGSEIRTVDLSAAGVAYDSPTWIEPFTKLEIIFVFPAGADPGGDSERLVRVDAVVMRTEPEEPAGSVGSYRVGCCFTRIKDEDKDFVAGYVDRILQASGAGA